MINDYAKISLEQKSILNQYLPGLYTFILRKDKSNLSHLISQNLKTLGIRIPNHHFPCNLVDLIKRPLVTTSVNKHNFQPLRSIERIKITFPKIDIFKDKNINFNSRGSTIIDLTSTSNKVLRQGDGVHIL